jgi:D-cysteine desulfhydrase family pyridoxal phosphate-dependent enzyme
LAIRFDVERFPRVPLAHAPTPLEELPRLSEHLGGPPILVKRDDCTGLALGGNKVRKLEYLLAEARDAGADTVITIGGVQSNHARQTAAASARLGLGCELVLPRLVPRADRLYEESGNVLLDRLLGAAVHIVDDAGAALEKIAERMKAAERAGGKAAFIPSGGSTPTGALGYVRAAIELQGQCESRSLAPGRIIVAASSAGTQAGLVTGLAAMRSAIEVIGIAVYDSADETAGRVRDLARGTAERLETEAPPDDAIQVRGEYLGDGYGLPTEGMREALELCARLEGLVLDPVYTGKAMAGLIDLVRRGRVDHEAPIVFWHTGGMPALFAYG